MSSQPEERSVDSSALAPVEPEFVWPPASVDILEPVETTSKASLLVDVPGPAAGDPLLSGILASGITFEWHHAVAVIQQLLFQLAPDGHPEGNLPEAWAIRLTASGELSARLLTGPELPLAGLGTLLHQLLAGRPQPAALRLLVMQATATEQAISLASLREGLGQWERPNRQQSLAELYADAQGKVVPSQARVLPMPSVVTRALAPATPPAPAEAKARSNKHRRRRPVPIVGVAALAGLGFAIVLLVLVLSTGGGPAEAPASPEVVETEVPAATAAVESALPESVGPSPAQPVGASNASRPGSPPSQTAPSAANTTVPVRGRTGATPSAPRVPTASSTATARTAASLPAATIPGQPEPGPLRRAPALSGTESPVLPPAPDRAPVVAAAPRPATPAVPAAGRSLGRLDSPSPPIYSVGDPGITAPIALSTLPATADPGAKPSDLAVLELVIDERGTVESADFLNPDPHFRDRWWISAAKTWKFQPARLNGQPVKFRTRLTFMSGATLDPRVADR